MALRRLRKFARQGNDLELDMDGTIKSTAKNAGYLDIHIFENQMDQSMWKELKEIIGTKIKSQPRNYWVEIFSDTDGCVTPVLNMDEAQRHEPIILDSPECANK